MRRQNVDPIEYAKYWNFWLWQYTSRNPEYLDAYVQARDLSFGKHEDGEKERAFWEKHWAGDDSSPELWAEILEEDKKANWAFQKMCWEKFRLPGGYIKEIDEDNSSSKILAEALEYSLDWQIEGFSRAILDFSNVQFLDQKKLSYTADLNRPLTDLIVELTFYHAYLNTFFKEDRFTDEGKQKIIEVLRQENARVIKHFNKNFQLEDIPRAIGLWLWDYVNQSANEGDSVTITDAIKELCATPYPLRGYAPRDKNDGSAMKKLRRYYHMTNESIQKMEVLLVKP